jgi:hypothetical protein
MNNLAKLRQQCHVLIAKNGYSKKGGQAVLAGKIKVNKNSLSMALSGFRETASSEQLLLTLKKFLKEQNKAGADTALKS